MVAKKTAVSGDPAPAKKATAAGKATAKKAPAKKAPAKKASANKTAVAGKAPAEKATAAGKKTTAVRKTTAVEKRTATAKKAGAEGAAHAAKETGVRNVVAKKSTGAARKTAAAATSGLPKTRVTAAAAAPGELAVRPGEDPWTPQEVEEARAELVSEVLRLRAELDASEVAISGLMRDSGDGAGDDQADTGTKNITRESELALAANASSMLEQTERALERLEAGTYGLCENCGKPIGKARMQAFPRATLCVDCKQKQERRH
ncbi:TraR/DksA family transcriptional regulator [Streptomyces virginiae]|uniref:TraR/DksA family transcriptional regulator n=1 Tax=Streptomyces virginiae TaxID=1961 RepID=UPI0004CB3B98|nr:TraR/DksA C4-type zinc finger protein [Streptomyces virginiae]